MTFISTNPVDLNVSKNELMEYLTDVSNAHELFKFKKVRHFKQQDSTFGFLLKWAAVFNYEVGEVTNDFVQFDSLKGDPFITAFRFEIEDKSPKSALVINYQADTTPYMQALFEKKMKRLIAAMIENLEAKFS